MSPEVRSSISRRAYQSASQAFSWEEIFEAGPYYRRVSELLEDAQHYAIFVGWQIDSRLPLPRPFRPGETARVEEIEKTGVIESLKEKILRLVESKPAFQFYFLMWDHAYFYVLEREAWQGRIWDNLHPRVHFLFDNRHPVGGSHHEKICIVDGTTAFCGGIDLCDERWDSPQHLYSDPRRSLRWESEHHGPYHDVAVQVTGPVCGVVQEHIRTRWNELSTIPFPEISPVIRAPKNPEAGHRVYVSRTLAQVELNSRNPVTREIEFMFRDLIATAERRIILEGQYYWSDEINDMLVAKLHSMKGRDFELILILADLDRLKALTRQLSIYELKLLEKLETAARLVGAKLTIGFPHVHPPELKDRVLMEERSKPIYIHSKVMIIDDHYLAIGSANMADRALRLDTELTLTLEARTDAEHAHIRRFTQSVLTHWNLQPGDSKNSDVHLHPVNPSRELRRRQSELSLAERFVQNYIPWKLFFDPKIPWFQPIERKFGRLAKSRFPWLLLLTAALWGLSIALSAAIARAFGIHAFGHWALLYALVLNSVWFAPMPYSWVAALSIFQLGFDTGVTISICSLWVSALFGYWLTRAFPDFLTRFYRPSGPSWLPKRLGLRRFPSTVAVTLDPRLTLRSKIAYQGLYCVPIPWFATNLLLVLPSALYGLLLILHEFVGPEAVHAIRAVAPKALIALAAYAFIRLAGSTFRKENKSEEKTP